MGCGTPTPPNDTVTLLTQPYSKNLASPRPTILATFILNHPAVLPAPAETCVLKLGSPIPPPPEVVLEKRNFDDPLPSFVRSSPQPQPHSPLSLARSLCAMVPFLITLHLHKVYHFSSNPTWRRRWRRWRHKGMNRRGGEGREE